MRFGAILTDLGAHEASKVGQKGPKRRQKRDQNDIEILIDFVTDFGPILGRINLD